MAKMSIGWREDRPFKKENNSKKKSLAQFQVEDRVLAGLSMAREGDICSYYYTRIYRTPKVMEVLSRILNKKPNWRIGTYTCKS